MDIGRPALYPADAPPNTNSRPLSRASMDDLPRLEYRVALLLMILILLLMHV